LLEAVGQDDVGVVKTAVLLVKMIVLVPIFLVLTAVVWLLLDLTRDLVFKVVMGQGGLLFGLLVGWRRRVHMRC
jgi:hypothetical protein